MHYKILETGKGLVVEFEGAIDLDCSAGVSDVLIDSLARTGRVEADLSRVVRIDSSGVSALIQAFQYARRLNKTFVLVDVSGPVLRVLKLAKMDSVFVIEARKD